MPNTYSPFSPLCHSYVLVVQMLRSAGGHERLKSECLSDSAVVGIQHIIKNHIEETWLPAFLSTTKPTERQEHKAEVAILIPPTLLYSDCQINCSCCLFYWRFTAFRLHCWLTGSARTVITVISVITLNMEHIYTHWPL